MRVESIERDSPATVAGLAAGDIVVAIDGVPVADVDGLQAALAADAIGREVALEVLRRDRRLTLAAVPRERSGGTPRRPGGR